MHLVVDSSIAACWALPDEFSEIANRALDVVRDRGMIVPPIFFYEIRNVLITNERRKRISAQQIGEALGAISAVSPTQDPTMDGDALMRLSRAHGLTIYDAAYLEIAIRTGASLATLDRKLAAAATKEGIEVIA